MGANIGTTLTGQIIAFKVTHYAWLMVAIGVGLQLFIKRDTLKLYGTLILGLGLLFLGMEKMSEAASPLREFEPFINLMAQMDNRFLAILAGAIFTAMVQSSSATIGIIIMLSSQGFLSLEAGIALAFGANIGTCVTAMLASIGQSVDARRAAMVHVIFNVTGTLLWVGFIGWLADIAQLLSPSDLESVGTEKWANETPRQIANANTVFNVSNTLILIWFASPIAKLASVLVPHRRSEELDHGTPRYLDKMYLETPPLAFDRVLLELHRMGSLLTSMLSATPNAILRGDEKELQNLEKMDEAIDHIYASIVDYLRSLGKQSLSESESARLESLIAAANYLEHMGDLVETNLVVLGRQRMASRIKISPQSIAAIEPLTKATLEHIGSAIDAYCQTDFEAARRVIDSKEEVYGMADQAMQHLSRRLLADEPNRVKAFSIESDIVSQFKRLFYISRRLAKLSLTESKPD